MTFEMLMGKGKVQLSHLVEYWIDNIEHWQMIRKRGEFWNSSISNIAPISCNERIEFSRSKVRELTGF